jgi:hypothetical protein
MDSTTPLRLVVPNGVTLKGDNLEANGQEPTTQAVIYTVKGSEFRVQVQGTGTLARDDSSAEQGAAQEDTGQPQIQEATPRLYDRMGLILGLTFGILLLGSILLWRSGSARPAKGNR